MMRTSVRLRQSAIEGATALLAAAVVLLASSAHAADPRVLIVKSDSLPQYEEPIARFTQSFTGTTEVINIAGSKKRGRRLLEQAASKGPVAGVFALGTQAAYLSKMTLPKVPMSFAMVLDHQRYGLAPPATGVSVEIPVDALITRFKLALPNIERLGLIKSDKVSQATVDAARSAAQTLGMCLVVEEVRYADEVAGAYRRLRSSIDALWMPADPTVVTRQSFRYLSERTRNDGIAFLAFSENFVRAGALLSISPDYATMGSQAAVLLERLIADPTSPQPVQPPLGSTLAINAKTADEIDLELGAAIRMMADSVVAE